LKEINKKVEKFYTSGRVFKAYINNEDLLPIEIKLPKITQKELQKSFVSIQDRVKRLKETGLPLVYKEFCFKTIGSQKLPTLISFANLDEYLSYIGKKSEYDKFVKLYGDLTACYPTLKSLIYDKPFLILEYGDRWQMILKVLDFFVQDRQMGCYIRELSIEGVDTKFIENHKKVLDVLLSNILENKPLNSISNFFFEKKYHLKYPQPQIRYRILDKDLYIQGLSDLEVVIDEFKKLNIGCKKVFIIENKITFLSFFDIKRSIAIFGSGYKLSGLKDVAWLRDKEIFYWSDIDEDGFAMLSQIRGYFPQTKSIFMDSKTIEKYKNLAVSHNNQQNYKELPNLTKEEQVVYMRLQNDFYGKNFRLEQERIPFNYIHKFLSKK